MVVFPMPISPRQITPCDPDAALASSLPTSISPATSSAVMALSLQKFRVPCGNLKRAA